MVRQSFAPAWQGIAVLSITRFGLISDDAVAANDVTATHWLAWNECPAIGSRELL